MNLNSEKKMTSPKDVRNHNKWRRYDKVITIPEDVRQKIVAVLMTGSDSYGSLGDVCRQFKDYNITRGYLMKMSARLQQHVII